MGANGKKYVQSDFKVFPFLPFCLSNSRTSLIFRGERGQGGNEGKRCYWKEGKKRNGNEKRREEKEKGVGKSVRNENEKVIERKGRKKAWRGEKELGCSGGRRRRRRL
jgi:hypothetical protein